MHWSTERDMRLRHEAMAWLSARTHDGSMPLSGEDLADFRFDGERLALIDRQRGIRKPAVLDAALSIRTVYTPPGRPKPYDDLTGLDERLRYKWRGTESQHPENVALRRAMDQRLPLIWFFGVGRGQHQPMYPVYLVAEEAAQHQFVVGYEPELASADPDSPVEAALRRYVLQETKVRLHQPVFRATVMRAYGTRCAVCSLRHGELLDAAHIVPDSTEGGIASVTNGLALCRIHHAAYDRRILGIRPDYVVQIRHDLLDEIDGPMLEHGLKGRHDQPLMVLPEIGRERPDRDLLAQTWEHFTSGGTG
ncbi:HNH endonuclease [Allobranchiibius huperziae]|nr:HNH endonuclease [Allobranchiibius huperziae]